MTKEQNLNRVLIIHCYYKIKSGECVIAHNETELLRSNGISTELFTMNNQSNLFVKLFNLLAAPFNVVSFFKVYRKIKLFKPDIVHVHNWFFVLSPSVFFAARLCKVRVVHSIHNYRLLCPSGTLFYNNQLFLNSVNSFFPVKAIINKTYKKSFLLTLWLSCITRMHHVLGTWKNIDCLVVNSAFAKQLFVNSYMHLNADKIVTKTNFNFYEETEVSINRSDNYLFSGRLSEEKGLLFLLDVAATMDFKLTIVGDGDDIVKQAVINYAAAYPNITYLGRQPREIVLQELKQCTAIIFPSLWFEGMPLSIVEAMQAGTPVIASNLGVMQEMIQHKENGLLFKPNDRAELEKAIRYWESLSFEQKEKYHIAAYNSFLQNYTPQKNVADLLHIYKTVISEN